MTQSEEIEDREQRFQERVEIVDRIAALDRRITQHEALLDAAQLSVDEQRREVDGLFDERTILVDELRAVMP